MSYLAKIEFLKVSDPNCRVKYMTGMRPALVYQDNELWDCHILLLSCDEAEPGAFVDAEVHFLTPDAHMGKIEDGLEFNLYAGPWNIARGKFIGRS